MANVPSPEVRAAITKGIIAEFVLVVLGGAIFFFTDEIAWIIGGALVGSAVIVLLLAQAGAFKRP
jgi:hypothetical protein